MKYYINYQNVKTIQMNANFNVSLFALNSYLHC